jgi:hypothetical protein
MDFIKSNKLPAQSDVVLATMSENRILLDDKTF